MWDNPSIPLHSGQTGQPVSSLVPDQSGSFSQEPVKKPVCQVPPVQHLPGAEASEPSGSGVSTSEKVLQQRTLKLSVGSCEHKKTKTEEVEVALEQFHKDSELCRKYGVPLLQLPEKLTPDDYLTRENVKHILATIPFGKKFKGHDQDALSEFVIQKFPAPRGIERDILFLQKAKKLLKVDASVPENKRALTDLRNQVRIIASAAALRDYNKKCLEICKNQRSRIQQIELERKSEARATESGQTVTGKLPGQVTVTVLSGSSSQDRPSEPHSPEIDVTGSDSDPMDASEAVQPWIGSLLTKDESQLYPLLQKKQGYYLTDGLPYTQYMLPLETRNQLISAELKEQLSMKAKWRTGRYFELAPASDTSSLPSLMKQAKFDPLISDDKPLGVALSDTTEGHRVLASYTTKKASGLKVVLNEVSEADKGRTLALYNTHLSKTICVSTGKQNHYPLKPGCGVLMQPHSGRGQKAVKWQPVAEYRLGAARVEETNPLIRDLPGPVEKPGVKSLKRRADGEYFLTPQMVADLAGQKSNTEGKPEVCFTAADILSALKTAFGKKGEKEGATSFIFCERNINHSVAVRVLRRNGKALVYIHETLDPASVVSRVIRDQILNAAQRFFSDSTLSFITPGFTSQVDFSSCGVFAYKAITAFEKHAELDSWLWEQAQQPGRVVQYERKELRLDNNLIPLSEMKSQLLKNYQGDKSLLSADQLEKKVSRKKDLTLEQYFEAHQPSGASGKDRRVNLSTTGKRYKYLLQWQEKFLKPAMPPAPEMKQQVAAVEHVSVLTEEDLLSRFQPIIDAAELDETNEWLAQYMPNAAPVSESDWEMSCVFENFTFGTEQLSLTDARTLNTWLDQALKHPEDPHHQLMQAWCIFIKQSEQSQFKNIPLSEVQASLKALIKDQPTDSGVPAKAMRSDGAVLANSGNALEMRKRPSNDDSATEFSLRKVAKIESSTITANSARSDAETTKPVTRQKRQRHADDREKIGLSKRKKRAKTSRYDHNAQEALRRQQEKTGFSQLAEAIGCEGSKQEILNETIKVVKQLQKEEASLLEEKDACEKKHRELEEELYRLIKVIILPD